jgi:hypothetical protein
MKKRTKRRKTKRRRRKKTKHRWLKNSLPSQEN